MNLTRRQQEIYDYLLENQAFFDHPPSLDELCRALNLTSRGSLHKHIQALIQAGLIEPMDRTHRGIRLTQAQEEEEGIPFLGTIAAGRPIEAVPQPEYLQVPDELLGRNPCYALKVRGDSMIDEGIQLVMNSTEGAQAVEDSKSIRSIALYDKIPYFTTAAGSHAAALAIKAQAEGDVEVKSLQG